MIAENLAEIQRRIEAICRRQGRSPQDVTLVGVTKYASLDQIHTALQQGVRHVGENRVQEARYKFSILGPELSAVTRHMIGHLQTNKVSEALELFDLIQSVDRIKLVKEIAKAATRQQKEMPVLIQVNTSGEAQKFGVPKAQALALVREAAGIAGIKIQGLMTIAPLTDDEEVIRRTFADLRGLFEQIGQEFTAHPNVCMRHLSMGMTHDFEIALEEGANMLRIGSALFKGISTEPRTSSEAQT